MVCHLQRKIFTVHNRPQQAHFLVAGTFKLTLEFSEEYPNKAPVVKFKSTMFHPNSASLPALPNAA